MLFNCSKRASTDLNKFSVCSVGDDGVYHLVVAINHGFEFYFPLFITLEGKLRGLQEFVRDTAKRAHDNHYTLFLSLVFNDTFQAEDAFTEPTDVPPNFNTFICS